MAWSKIDEGSGFIPVGSSSTTVTFNVALAQNDIVIAVFGDDDGLGVADFLSSGWSTLHSNAGVDPGRLVMYKRMGATPDTSFSFDQDGQVRTAYVWQVWRGADTTTAIDATATTATGASGLPDAPSYTPVTNGALVFAVGIQDDDDASAGLAAPTGYTNLLSSDTGQGSTTVGATVMIASKELATAAAENPAAFTGGSGNDAWAAITFALRPAASGAQSITGALFTNSQTFYGATVGRGAVNIDGALVTNIQTFYGAAITATYGITGAKFDNSQTFYAATVTPGSVDIAGALFTSGQTFYQATVAPGAVDIAGSLYTNTQTFYGASIVQDGADQTITAALYTNAQAFFEATVAVGAVDIAAELFTNEQVFFGATVSPVSAQTQQRGDDAPSGRNRFYVTRHYYVIGQPESRKQRKAKPRKPVTQAVVEEAISTLPQWAAVQFTPATAMQALPSTISLNRAAIDRSTETLALVDMIRAELLRQAQDDEDDIELLLMVA